jgi:two-component system, chemotaxis family, chemotaxis protein CheY
VFHVGGEAENERETIEKAEQLSPDLITMDLSMPVMNGLDATRFLNRVMPNVPVVLFSGYSDQFKPEEARSAGISALVSKSDPATLLDVAHEVLRRQAA